jgi:hypothetical protein
MDRKLPTPKFKPITLGSLPHDSIGSILNIRLSPGVVHFSIPAQKHAFKQHPKDFHTCLPYLSQAIQAPTYAGQSPRHTGTGFEVILSIPSDGIHIMVAITLRRTNNGVYHVKSVYLVDSVKISSRIKKKHLAAL